jgi:hypothetical protein
MKNIRKCHDLHVMIVCLFHDMFVYDVHDMFVYICFTMCLCISPDLDGYQGTENETLSPERPTKGPETQSRSDSTAGAFKHRLP